MGKQSLVKHSRIVDANLTVSLVLPTPYSAQTQALWERWHAEAADVFAPDLWVYEITSSFVSEMRLAAAVKWYETRCISMHRISQAKAAEVAGLSRGEFLTALARFDVSPFQYDADEIVAEVSGA